MKTIRHNTDGLMLTKTRCISFLMTVALTIISAATAFSQSRGFSFSEGKKLYGLSASYFDGPINIPADCSFSTPSFHYRYEISLVDFSNGESGALGIGYRAGAGGIEQKIWEYKQVLDGEPFKTGNYTTETSIRITVEATLSYHYPIVNYVDAYVRGGIGFVPTYRQIEKQTSYTAKDYLCYGGVVGVQAMIKGKFGAFVEAGVASQVLSAGIVWSNSTVSSILSQVFGGMF